MSRDICGICWCPYDDDGRCECEPAPLLRDDTALLRQALEALEYSYGCIPLPQTGPVIDAIAALKERLK